MDIFGLGKIWTPLILAGAVLAVLGGTVWWINDSAFSRGKAYGVAETTRQMTAAVKAMRDEAVAQAMRWRNTPPSQIDDELRKRCVRECQDNAQCIAACQ